MQIYQAYLQIAETPALFTAMNGDTGEVYAELVPFDHTSAQAASDRGLRVVSAEFPTNLPRIAKEPTDYRCKWCDYAGLCWEGPKANLDSEPPQRWGGFGAPAQ